MNPVMIVNKATGSIWRASSGKVGWKLPAHAKNAWAASFEPCIPKHLRKSDGWNDYTVRFHCQDEYEVVFIEDVLKELYELRGILESLEK